MFFDVLRVGSLIGLGSLTGNIIFGLLLDRLGRKVCMYFLAIPNMVDKVHMFFKGFPKSLSHFKAFF